MFCVKTQKAPTRALFAEEIIFEKVVRLPRGVRQNARLNYNTFRNKKQRPPPCSKKDKTRQGLCVGERFLKKRVYLMRYIIITLFVMI